MLLVVTKRWHGKHSFDTIEGLQKFHSSPTPRIGGVAIFIGLIIACLFTSKPVAQLLRPMIIASLPAFAAGITEDLTKRVGVRDRLFATIISGALSCLLTGYSLNHLNIIGVDVLLAYLPISVAFTAIAVGGVANSINIIDGFNGLASGVIIICFSALGFISWQVGDLALAQLCLLLIIVAAGFFVINFPFGKIFMGDGGAYLLGFMLAWVAVLLPMRNATVSIWASLMVCAYPVMETCFSMWRKHHRKGHTPGMPDNVHLHMLIYSRVSRVLFSTASPALKNGLTSVFIWPFSILCALIGIIWSSNTTALIIGLIICAVVYRLVYLRLTQFVWCLTPATHRKDKCISKEYAKTEEILEDVFETQKQSSLINQSGSQPN
jgi:UDP-N-acetylmuramyl pentapeptide phosphotransferase/UDP-N-acetylglucosamine-1-phosphate transferase